MADTIGLMEEKRVRVTIDLPERIRRALYIRAARLNTSTGELVEGLIAEHFPEDVKLADDAISSGAAPPKGKPGRRPKD